MNSISSFSLKAHFWLINTYLKDKIFRKDIGNILGGEGMKKILAFYGSPRRKGNTAALLDHAVQGPWSRSGGRKNLSSGSKNVTLSWNIWVQRNGRCVIQDDFQKIHDQLMAVRDWCWLLPSFFTRWVPIQRPWWIAASLSGWKSIGLIKCPTANGKPKRKGLFISWERQREKAIWRTPSHCKIFFWCSGYGSSGKRFCIEDSTLRGCVEVSRASRGGLWSRERTGFGTLTLKVDTSDISVLYFSVTQKWMLITESWEEEKLWNWKEARRRKTF